ncbi:50S ribosomal protein L19 [Candidatus Curtissbacteria bacterium RIFCSPHIGHO2_02_FULL_42_15]|uniref:50S ribosomal protein L19 n=1 Tax=Candidatus Curtissbacteria bacterium RIFCSPHIGHO2_02_FULL_42_15 TaxID=1797716 RepID=A0A1F5GDE5_9BACT|nr:MAG: 50S ribosomal protein L19 [Candidatus Curtissbacteria bacterium RIFCSPHIGHO2_02_FULL_42_15]
MNKKATNFKAGDIVKVIFKIPSGVKTRPTPFEGIVIAVKGDLTERTFTVRKSASQRVVVERIFAINSPSIENINVVKKSKVRRAKLYYLRKR